MSVALFVAEVVVPTLIRTGNGSRGGDGYSGGVEAGDVSGVGDGVKGDFGGGDDRENDDSDGCMAFLHMLHEMAGQLQPALLRRRLVRFGGSV